MTSRNRPRRTARPGPPTQPAVDLPASTSPRAASSSQVAVQTKLTAAMLRQMVFGDPLVQQHAGRPGDDNGACATRVIDLLRPLAPSVPHVLRQVLIWSSSSDRMPLEHLVVVVSLDAQEWVIDPTAALLPGLAPMIERTATWVAALCAATPNNCVIKWADTTIVNATVFPVMMPPHAVPGELIRPARWIWSD